MTPSHPRRRWQLALTIAASAATLLPHAVRLPGRGADAPTHPDQLNVLTR